MEPRKHKITFLGLKKKKYDLLIKLIQEMYTDVEMYIMFEKSNNH